MNSFNVDSAKDTRTGLGVMLPVFELVIAIGLFTILSIFLIRFFTSANTMSRQADDLSKGLIKAESAIELVKAYSTDEAAKELAGEVVKTAAGKNIEAYFDKDWKKTDKTNWRYSLVVMLKDIPRRSGALREINAFINRNDGVNNNIVIVHLEGAKYLKGGR